MIYVYKLKFIWKTIYLKYKYNIILTYKFAFFSLLYKVGIDFFLSYDITLQELSRIVTKPVDADHVAVYEEARYKWPSITFFRHTS